MLLLMPSDRETPGYSPSFQCFFLGIEGGGGGGGGVGDFGGDFFNGVAAVRDFEEEREREKLVLGFCLWLLRGREVMAKRGRRRGIGLVVSVLV